MRDCVGRSSRTPFKHWVLNAHLGKVCGVLSTGHSKVPAKANPFLCVDLCAGDGTEVNGHRASPKIIAKHCDFLHCRGFDAQSVMIEKHSQTYDRLRKEMDAFDVKHYMQIECGDARDYVVCPTSRDQAIFVNCDPNSIADFPYSQQFSESLTPTTTVTMTMGCNVGGLKRMSLEKRQQWYEYIAYIERSLPRFHDAILVALNSDTSQWAYLTRIPSKWSEEQLRLIQKRGNSMFENGVTVASYRCSRERFCRLVDSLFLTKSEFNSGR